MIFQKKMILMISPQVKVWFSKCGKRCNVEIAWLSHDMTQKMMLFQDKLVALEIR